MIANPEYDLSAALATAIKGRAPFVGVPVPGHAPLVLDRKRLAGALRGVTPTNIEVTWTECGKRSLLVEGRDGRIRTRFKMVCRAWKEWEVQREMDRFERAEQRKNLRVISLPANTDRKTAAEYRKQATLISKLERELEKLGKPYGLHNPAVPQLRPVTQATYDYSGPLWRDIRGGKRLRTIVGGIAAQARRESWNSFRLYKELEEHGIEFEKLSSMTPRTREARGAETFHDYLKNLHRFCVGCGAQYRKDSWQFARGEYASRDHQQWGAARYMAKLADIQMRRSLQSQIDSIKTMMTKTNQPMQDAA